MRPIKTWLFAVVLGVFAAAEIRAEHAKITLEVVSSRGKETAHVDQTPPDAGKIPRPVVKAKAGETIKIDWEFTNVYPHKTIENALLYFYVAKEAKVGQKELPDLSENSEAVIVQTAFEMDFKPGGRAKGHHKVKIDEPGVYLVRLQTVKTQSDHEHFAAIDLVVEAPEDSKKHVRFDRTENAIPRPIETASNAPRASVGAINSFRQREKSNCEKKTIRTFGGNPEKLSRPYRLDFSGFGVDSPIKPLHVTNLDVGSFC